MKATSAEAMVAGKVVGVVTWAVQVGVVTWAVQVGVVTWAVQVALGGTGMTQTVAELAAALGLSVLTDTGQAQP
jgi:hypothetical protein